MKQGYFFPTRHSLFIMENDNLMALWGRGDETPLRLLNGTMFFHQNPKLCLNKIVQFANWTGQNITNDNASPILNGVEAACKYF